MINRRVLAIILAITMATSASVSSGFDVFASEVPAAQEELTETEENILETVDAILDKKDADEESGDKKDSESVELSESTDSQTEEEADEIVIETEGTDVKKADIKLTASAEDGTVVTVKALADEFPYENLTLAVNVVTGTEAENASEEIDAENPAENTAKRVTYDVQVKSNGEEVQPVYGRNVKVSFSVSDAPSGADDVTVYHHDENEDKPVEIASAELSGASETAVVGATAGSESRNEDAETEVIICNTDAGNTSAVTSSDTDDDENYEDYELIDDVTVSGETTSFSYYTVDFTYNEKKVSIDGDTEHNELSNVLANIGITDAITDAAAYMDAECTELAANNTVTVDGKDLFRIYEEGGTWYVDAKNAFTSEHGLWVKAGDAEYKIKVTDASYLVYTVHGAEGIDLVDDNSQYRYGNQDINIYSDMDGEVIVDVLYDYKLRVKAMQKNGYYNYKVLNAYATTGYNFKTWHVDSKSAQPEAEIRFDTITVSIGGSEPIDEEGCLVVTEGDTVKVVKRGESASIAAPNGALVHFDGETMTIDGWNGNVKASSSEHREFSSWKYSLSDNTVWTGASAMANFAPKKEDYTITVTPSETGKICCREGKNSIKAERNSQVNIDADWVIDVMHTENQSYKHEYIICDGYTDADGKWEFYKFNDFQKGYLTDDLTITACYVNEKDCVEFTALQSPFGGEYQTKSADGCCSVGDTATVSMVKYEDARVSGNEIRGEFSGAWIRADADLGCEFVKWVDENGNDLPEIIHVDKNLSVRAIYRNAEEQHIHISANEGGSVVYEYGSSKDYEFSISSAAGTFFKVDPNNKARLIMTYADANKQQVMAYYDAVPNSGYMLAEGDVWTGLPNGNLFTTAEITANFTESHTKVTFKADNDGAVLSGVDGLTDITNQEKDVLKGSTIIKYGSRIGFAGDNNMYIASPSDGFVFKGWTISPETDVITSPVTITANFESAGSTYMVTPTVDGAGGKVVPMIPVKVASGSTIKGGQFDAKLTIGNETFIAASDGEYYFKEWEFSTDGSSFSSTKPDVLNSDLAIRAAFLASSSIASPSYVTFATPASGGRYDKTFSGDTITVPGNSTAKVESKKEGNDGWLIFDNGRAYVHAIADSDYTFNCWVEDENGREFTGTTIPADVTLRATFLYQGDYPDPWIKPNSNNTTTYSSGGALVEEEALDKTNYHAEKTYGSWENPINDGEWEYLANDTWKYNSSTPMKNCWACIVNPYANVDKGQHAHDWFFFDPYGHMMTGWRMIDGKWYYFEPISNGCRGQLYMGTTTPDGYTVDANGALIQ